MAYMCLHGYGECDSCGYCSEKEEDKDAEQ